MGGPGLYDPRSTVVERRDLVVNWADFPSVIEDANGVLFAHWLQKSGGAGDAYAVRMSISKNGGATWSAPMLLNRDGKRGEHGFVTLASLPGGGAGAVWLADATLRFATIDGCTCDAARPAWPWRPAVLHADGWKIAGCPVNGPQIDARGSRVAAAWFTAANDRPRAYVAFSDDAGATFGAPVAVDDGKPLGRVDVVLLDDATAVVTWLEQTPAGAELRARRIARGGQAGPSLKVADSSAAPAAGFARAAVSGSDVYVAWTEQSASSKRVHVARIRP